MVVDKPSGPTSHDVVARVRRIVGSRKVGHAGTLDPMATGVLVVGVERATRLLGHLTVADKAYDATICLGVATVTDDRTGAVLTRTDTSAVTDEQVRAGVLALTGPQVQRPSAVSAVSVDGVRAYARVRAGEPVQLPGRPVTVSCFTVHELRRRPHEGADAIEVDVSVVVSSGTYVRALARDLGDRLGVGGHLTALRRTRSGWFDLSRSRTLDQLAEDASRGPVGLPMLQVVEAVFGTVAVDGPVAARVLHGNPVPLGALATTSPVDGPVGVVGPDGVLLSLAQRHGEVLRHLVVFS